MSEASLHGYTDEQLLYEIARRLEARANYINAHVQELSASKTGQDSSTSGQNLPLT